MSASTRNTRFPCLVQPLPQRRALPPSTALTRTVLAPSAHAPSRVGKLGLAWPCFDPPALLLGPCLRAPRVHQTWARYARQGGSPCPDLSPPFPPRTPKLESLLFLPFICHLSSYPVVRRLLRARFVCVVLFFFRFSCWVPLPFSHEQDLDLLSRKPILFPVPLNQSFLVFGFCQRQTDYEPAFRPQERFNPTSSK